MRVSVQKNNEGGWSIFPLSGKFCGICIAHADEIALSAPVHDPGGISGEMVSVWGMSIVKPEVYDDEPTLTGLCIGKPFALEMKMDRVTFGCCDGA